MIRRRGGNIIVAMGLLGAWLVGPLAHAATPEPLYDSKGKRDPFVPLVHEGRFVAVSGGLTAGSPGASDLQLAGIVWDPAGQSFALINDTEVKVGDRLGEYEVTEIRPDAVVLVRDGKPVVLQLSFENAEPSRQ